MVINHSYIEFDLKKAWAAKYSEIFWWKWVELEMEPLSSLHSEMDWEKKYSTVA